MKLKLFVTGGTFDKQYNELNAELVFDKSHLPDMLQLARSRVDLSIQTLMMVDSLNMSDDERLIIARKCIDCEEDYIVVTHGTDTMVETASCLAKQVEGKTIVLTGAMIPYAFGSSDGLFNLGAAMAFAQVLAPGVYIAMNGLYFHWDNVRKNRTLGIFEEIRPLF